MLHENENETFHFYYNHTKTECIYFFNYFCTSTAKLKAIICSLGACLQCHLSSRVLEGCLLWGACLLL